jgi:hypothetical protein
VAGSPNTAPGSAAKKKAGPKTAGLGQPVKDGKFTFTVTKVERGPARIGDQYLGKTAQGKFVFVHVTVQNHGDEAQSFLGVQEGRHALARKIFHGRAGQRYQRYQGGMEDQIGALGLVLNALVLFNTRYMDAAVAQLRADGFDVRDEDVTGLSPFVRHHINMLGRYSFELPDLPGGMRPLGVPDAGQDVPLPRPT